ncbi:adenylate/guanylate cyclase domain-containing protein [Thermodesulfobacteriota bacterium]
MNSDEFKRKLAAIFSADVVGYSRLMGDDEAATVNTITVYREVIGTLIRQHRGRIVDSQGDNVLADFASVVDAAQCAVAVQKELQSRNAELPENRRMHFRIGINLGDVIEEGERLYGDGVNIAARLEALADPGGICISKTAFDHIETKLPLGYKYIGEQTVKNISKPVSAYKVLMDPRVITTAKTKEIKEKTARPKKPIKAAGITIIVIVVVLAIMILLSRFRGHKDGPGFDKKPSIAVLPFKNMSDDPKQTHFSDGITEELINALANVEGLKVTSRTSAFYFKEKDVDLRTIGEKLGVDNILEGSVRKSGNKLRITAQLISVEDDTHLWSEIYDRDMKDIFNIQDEISKAVVTKLKVKLLGEEKIKGVEGYNRRFDLNVIVEEEEIITGGLLACAANLEIAGSIKDGLKAYGANVVISGINQNNLDFGGAHVILSGAFQGKVKGGAGKLTLSGIFEDDIEVRAAKIIVAPTALIKGNLAYSAGLFERQEGSQITGKVIRLDTEEGRAWFQKAPKKEDKSSPFFGRIFRIISLIAIIIVGVLINLFFPKQTEAIVSTITGSFWKSMGVGLVFLIVTPLCIIVSLATLVGIPAGIIAVFLFIIMIYISRVYVGLWIGRMLLGLIKDSYTNGFFWPFLTGIIIISIFSLIPFLGWLLKVFLLLISLGAMWQFIWKAVKPVQESVK